MPRLYHTKSRNGCVRCRKRKVKCDEVHPSCGGCTRHQVACVYDRVPDRGSPADHPVITTPSSSHTVESRSPAVNYGSVTPTVVTELDGESTERRLRELAILHLYTTEVSPTIPGTSQPEAKHTWQVDVPALATDYEPLLNAVIAVSILYMVRTGNTKRFDRTQLLTHRAQYLEASLLQFRKALDNPSKRIADAVCFMSSILCFDQFASSRDRTVDPYLPPTQWLQLCKGVINVYKVALPLVRDDPNAKINQIVEASTLFVASATRFSEANLYKFAHLLSPERKIIETDGEDALRAYATTLGFLGDFMIAHEAGEHIDLLCRKILIFPILFPIDFVDLVTEMKPRALAIMAHYFGLMSICSKSWLIGDTPEREVRAIAAHLGDEWAAIMKWPLRMIEKMASPQ